VTPTQGGPVTVPRGAASSGAASTAYDGSESRGDASTGGDGRGRCRAGRVGTRDPRWAAAAQGRR
jgi:hypothetical protein